MFASVVVACIYTLIVFGVMIGLLNNPQGYAQSIQNNSTLSVSGTATMKTNPDRVTVSFGVETANTTASLALMSNSEITNKVLNILKASGVHENETTTSSFV